MSPGAHTRPKPSIRLSAAWQKVSRSGLDGCVEVRIGRISKRGRVKTVQLRESTRPRQTIVIPYRSWRIFLAGVRAGDFMKIAKR